MPWHRFFFYFWQLITYSVCLWNQMFPWKAVTINTTKPVRSHSRHCHSLIIPMSHLTHVYSFNLSSFRAVWTDGLSPLATTKLNAGGKHRPANTVTSPKTTHHCLHEERLHGTQWGASCSSLRKGPQRQGLRCKRVQVDKTESTKKNCL